MDGKEILAKLKEGANFELSQFEGRPDGYGSIRNFPECKEGGSMTLQYYQEVHYYAKKKILEALPWTKVVKDTYHPTPDEYPTEDGFYITMLNCDEHAVWVNEFKDGHWMIYNRTHVKWWMPIPEV